MSAGRKLYFLAVLVAVTILASYIGAYCLSTEVHHGIFDGERVRIRLFRSSWHLSAFKPLLALETMLTHDVSGQVRGGASLPPSDEAR
jgi:hypothetical protein